MDTKAITIKTSMTGLLGNPLGQTLSPKMHNTSFENLGIDGVYIPWEITSEEDLVKALEGMKTLRFIGFNVTKPYKIAVLQYLDELDEIAKAIGSVNTVQVIDGKYKGYNTDGMGFCDALERECEVDVKGKNFMIYGAGGASRAVAVTLAFRGATNVYITDMYPEATKDLVDTINNAGFKATALDLQDEAGIKAALEDSQVVINASGLGMAPKITATPVKKELLRSDLIVCDLTYNPYRTQLLQDAESIGCKVMNGIGMVVNQGAKAFEIWTGTYPNTDLMREVVEGSLK